MHFSADSQTFLPLEPQRQGPPPPLPPTVLQAPRHPSPAQRPAYLGPTWALLPHASFLQPQSLFALADVGRLQQLRHELLLVGAPWEKSGTARRHQRRQGAAHSGGAVPASIARW